MEESVQHVVMAAIQHLLTNCTPATPVTSSREVEELQGEVFTVIIGLFRRSFFLNFLKSTTSTKIKL